MPSGFDYSKWDRLQDSEDEDTFHPNLDTGLNVRVNRITRDRKEEEIDQEQQKAKAEGKLEKVEQLESKRPLHVGNVCRVAEERTIVNWSKGSATDRNVKDGEEFSVDGYFEFKKEHAKLLDEFSEADWEKSHQMLNAKGDVLLDTHANNYFLLSALDEQMKGNKKQVLKLGRQGQIISQIHQLAKPMRRHPRDLVHRFFERFDAGEAKAAFQEGVVHFLKHIEKRAVDKRKEEEEEAAAQVQEQAQEQQAVPLIEAMYSMTPEERKGPGGLDPVEVFESLPKQFQECFKSCDVEMLKKVAAEMPDAEFDHHFKRCIDAGLWNAG